MFLSKFCNRSFVTRLLSGIILVAIALFTIISGGYILLATLLAVSLVGVYEIYRVFGMEKKPAGYIGYAAVILYYFCMILGAVDTIIIIVAFVMCLMAAYVFSFPDMETKDVTDSIFGVLYAAVMLSFIYGVRMGVNGAYNVWLIFLCSWGSDTCAYVAGVAFGRHKMAPVLSPKKSIEGAAGGVVGAALLALIYAAVFRDNIVTGAVDVYIAYPLICAAGACISMVGDLAASAIKRKHSIKDYGTLIPGHGGIMDRFDSVIFVAPVIWILVKLF